MNWYNLKQLPRKTLAFLKRIWNYRQVLWDDCDYDYTSILRMLQFKVADIRKHVQKHQLHTTWEEDVTSMLQVESLIRSILDDDFNAAAYQGHDTKWGKPVYSFEPIPGKPFSRFVTTRLNAKTEAELKQERREYANISDRANEMAQRAFKDLFDLLYTDLSNWWC